MNIIRLGIIVVVNGAKIQLFEQVPRGDKLAHLNGPSYLKQFTLVPRSLKSNRAGFNSKLERVSSQKAM